MTDELDVLRHERDVTEPDPEFRAELMDRLRREMADLSPSPLTLSAVRPGSTSPEGPVSDVLGVATDDPSTGRRRHGLRWLVAAAAAVVLIVAAVALTMLEDDENVDTVPSSTERPLPQPSVQSLPDRTVVSGSGCPFGISGAPVDLQPGPITGRFSPEGGQGVAHLLLGQHTVEVAVPAFDHSSGPDWQEEPVDLGGRQGIVWLNGPESASREGAGNLPFVQVLHVPEGDEPCSSFSVTVDGGTVEANRQVAEDVAARVLLPADMPDLDLPGSEGGPVAGLELPGTTWVMSASSGALYGAPAEMRFTDTTVEWGDGCATWTAGYELDRDEGILTLSDATSSDPGCTQPTSPEFDVGWPTVRKVMGAEEIEVELANGLLHLGGILAPDSLTLGPPAPDPAAPPELPEPGQPPADAAAAEEAVRTAFETLFDASLPPEERAQFVTRPAVWLPANQALRTGPYAQDVKDLVARVDQVVFTSPTHASVRYRLVGSSDLVPSNDEIGDAWLVDGRWLVDVITPCARLSLAGVTCDMSL